MKVREGAYTMYIGAPGYGKTTHLVEQLEKVKRLPHGLRKNAILYKSDMGIDDAAVKKFKLLKKGDNYTGGWAKVSDLEVDYDEFVEWVSKNFKNGSVIVDDAGFYEGHNITPQFKQLLRMRRHLGIDIYYVYHGLSDAPIQHFPFLSNIILFHTVDNARYKAKKLPQNGKLFFDAQEKLQLMVDAGHKYQPIVLKLA